MSGEEQCAGAVMVIRPARFGFDEETAASNRFQRRLEGLDGGEVQRRALAEFDELVARLRSAGVRVVVFEDTPEPEKPDAVFPNNWVSFHADGTVVLYPMQAEARRREVRHDLLEALADEGFAVGELVDLTGLAERGQFLEGTGSLILDRPARMAFACSSPRTHPVALATFATRMGYHAFAFEAVDAGGAAVYHTNVLMALGERFALACLESVRDWGQRRILREHLSHGGRELIEIGLDQMSEFAGNVLQLRGAGGRTPIVMSSRARASFSPQQVARLEAHGELVDSPLDTIEVCSGGSARCMLAEIFLPPAAGR